VNARSTKRNLLDLFCRRDPCLAAVPVRYRLHPHGQRQGVAQPDPRRRARLLERRACPTSSRTWPAPATNCTIPSSSAARCSTRRWTFAATGCSRRTGRSSRPCGPAATSCTGLTASPEDARRAHRASFTGLSATRSRSVAGTSRYEKQAGGDGRRLADDAARAQQRDPPGLHRVHRSAVARPRSRGSDCGMNLRRNERTD
jgi:hypothetical protein